MRSQITYYLFLGTLPLVAQGAPRNIFARQTSSPAPSSGNSTAEPGRIPGTTDAIASLPQSDKNIQVRSADITAKQKGFLYGPSLIGEASPFPSGPLGEARVAYDMALWDIDRKVIESFIAQDVGAVKSAIEANGGLKTLDDYTKVLYLNKWDKTIPMHEAPGIATNYTQDLLFSMERLSQNPYPLHLIKPGDKLPFQVPKNVLDKVAGASLEDLKAKGNLFFVDHTNQLKYEKTNKFGAACSAYFFIHPKSGDFLPLAIKTNFGSDLIYTPLDQPNDWLLAKMMFNVNDFFHAEMFHLAATHDIGEGVHEAAMRTLAENHPVMIILDRLMTQAYSARPVGEKLCFNVGGHWDENFFVSGVGTKQYITEVWPKVGAFQSNYLETDFKARGLIDGNDKFRFKTFPFIQDALAIKKGIKSFFEAFVDSYYSSDKVMAADTELQNWFVEASNGAKVIDFPQCGAKGKACGKKILVDVLTHMAMLNGVVHHALNSGDPVRSKATLPFHLNAMYAPVPKEKGVKDLIPFLPNGEQSLHYIMFLSTFNRPFYEDQKRTLAYAFSDDKMLARLNKETKKAADNYLKTMQKISKDIRGRSFDKNGLSLGMPQIWSALDPGRVPYFFSV